jgi:hypothetical protein
MTQSWTRTRSISDRIGRRPGGRVGLRISRIRAGTPTASLPAGTSRVTTAPAPVLAPSPMVTGARSIVSTPRKTRSPISVRCLLTPS